MKKIMKKKHRTLFVLALVFCLIFTSVSGAFAETRVTFGNTQKTVDTFNGVPAYYKTGYHNTDDTYSCAAYVKRYYKQIYNVSVSNLQYDRTPVASEKDYTFRQIGYTEVKPGDIGYQDGSSGGHWFIIKTVNGKSMTVIEQNWKKNSSSTSCTIDRQVTFGTTKNLKAFRLQKNGADVNGGSITVIGPVKDSQLIPNGRYAIMVNGKYCLNIQYAIKTADKAKLVIDPYNGETNELFDITFINGYYRISPVHAPNLALNAQYGKDAKAGQQLSCHTWRSGDDASLWSVEKYSDGFRFRNKANKNLYIDVANNKKSTVGNRINLWTKVNGSQQTLYLKNVNGWNISTDTSAAKDYTGRWAIKANAGYCLNVQYASRVSDAAKCVIDPYNREANEVFDFTRYGDYYRISPAHAPNLALNAQYGKDAKAGQQLSLHTWRNGDDASLWSIETYGSGVRFRNKTNTSLVIDVTNAQKSTTGCKIILWKQNGDEAQRFYLERA